MNDSNSAISVNSLIMTGYEDGYMRKKWRKSMWFSTEYRAAHLEGREDRMKSEKQIREAKLNGNA